MFALNLNSEVRGLVLVLVLEKLNPAVTPSEQINCGKIGFRCGARPKIENENDDEHDFSISEFALKTPADVQT